MLIRVDAVAVGVAVVEREQRPVFLEIGLVREGEHWLERRQTENAQDVEFFIAFFHDASVVAIAG